MPKAAQARPRGVEASRLAANHIDKTMTDKVVPSYLFHRDS